MIDIENELFSLIAQEVRPKYPNVFMTSEYVKVPSSFPCVTFMEVSNQAYHKTQTESDMENHAIVLYEVNVYSNKSTQKKAECRKIIDLIDRKMSAMGFHRNMMSSIPNLEDATIYRITARYQAVISKEKTIYRR